MLLSHSCQFIISGALQVQRIRIPTDYLIINCIIIVGVTTILKITHVLTYLIVHHIQVFHHTQYDDAAVVRD